MNDVLYLCNRLKCAESELDCDYPNCRYTDDIKYATSFEKSPNDKYYIEKDYADASDQIRLFVDYLQLVLRHQWGFGDVRMSRLFNQLEIVESLFIGSGLTRSEVIEKLRELTKTPVRQQTFAKLMQEKYDV